MRDYLTIGFLAILIGLSLLGQAVSSRCVPAPEGPGGVAAGQFGRVAEADHEGAGVGSGPLLRGGRAGEVPDVVDAMNRPGPT